MTFDDSPNGMVFAGFRAKAMATLVPVDPGRHRESFSPLTRLLRRDAAC
jgi:hypothetical protein